MKEVSKFNIIGEEVYVKDIIARQDVEKLNKRISNLKRRYIFVGDSYAVGVGSGEEFGWSYLVPRYLGLTSSDYYTACKGGIGFLGGTTFLNEIKSISSSIGDKNSITDIIVFGGFNDHNFQKEEILNAIKSFCEYCNSTYPKATISIGEIGWSCEESIKYGLVNNVLVAYSQCGRYGAKYVCGCEYIMHDYSMFNSDWIHPSTKGYLMLANYLSSAVLNGSVDKKIGYNNLELRAVSPATRIEAGILNETICGDICTITRASNATLDIRLNGSTIEGHTEYHVMDFNPHFLWVVGGFTCRFPISGYIRSGNINYGFNGEGRLEGGAFAFMINNVGTDGNYTNYPNATFITIEMPTVNFPSKYC